MPHDQDRLGGLSWNLSVASPWPLRFRFCSRWDADLGALDTLTLANRQILARALVIRLKPAAKRGLRGMTWLHWLVSRQCVLQVRSSVDNRGIAIIRKPDIRIVLDKFALLA
jgi:hypothetical protein